MKISYYELDNTCIGKETEKAFAIVTGYDGKIKLGHDSRMFQYIAKSLIKEVDNKLYIPTWLVNQDRLWDYVNTDNTIQIEDGKKKVRRTQEQKVKDEINKLINIKSVDTNNYIIVVCLNGGYTVRKFRGEKQINDFINNSVDYDYKEDECILIEIKENTINNIYKSNGYIKESKEAEKMIELLRLIYIN